MSRDNKRYSYFKDVTVRFFKHKLAIIGLVFLILELVLCFAVPLIAKVDPYEINVLFFNTKPTSKHILGTDLLGRDILSRLLYGGRVSLTVGIFSTIIGLVIGLPLGLCAGYFRGMLENIVMRLADIFLSFPSIVLILVLVAVIGPSIWSVIVVIGILAWPKFARIIYGTVLSIREQEYVLSARSLGARNLHIIIKHILPNSIAPILVAMTFQAAQAIIMEASLSFLGMGIQPPQASWGNMLYDAQSVTILSRSLWMWLPPGIAIITSVLSINVLGDGLRDALDPKMKI